MQKAIGDQANLFKPRFSIEADRRRVFSADHKFELANAVIARKVCQAGKQSICCTGAALVQPDLDHDDGRPMGCFAVNLSHQPHDPDGFRPLKSNEHLRAS